MRLPGGAVVCGVGSSVPTGHWCPNVFCCVGFGGLLLSWWTWWQAAGGVVQDAQLSYGAGLVEGFLTQGRIWQMFQNTGGPTPLPPKVQAFLTQVCGGSEGPRVCICVCACPCVCCVLSV